MSLWHCCRALDFRRIYFRFAGMSNFVLAKRQVHRAYVKSRTEPVGPRSLKGRFRDDCPPMDIGKLFSDVIEI